jgi:hypothetical protein
MEKKYKLISIENGEIVDSIILDESAYLSLNLKKVFKIFKGKGLVEVAVDSTYFKRVSSL